MPILQANNIFRILGEEVPVTLINGVSLSVEPGEFLTITGPSGSGKSSLLYLLGLLDRPSQGSIWLKGKDVTTLDEEMRADIRLSHLGFVFQFHFLLPEFTALENVMLPMQRLKKLSPEAIYTRAEKLLGDLGLAPHQHKLPRQLSGGQRQRVAIARAMANDPLIILADEPTGNLDTASAANVQDILKTLAHDYGRTIITVTHDPHFAAMADREITVVDGKVQSGD